MMYELFKVHLLFQLRNKQVLMGVSLFSIFLVFLFTLAFPPTHANHANLHSGVFWISSFFAGNLILTNQNQLNIHRFQQGLVLTGIDSTLVFFSKLSASIVYMILVQSILFVCISLFFNLPEISFVQLILYALLGSIGYMSLGTLFFSLSEFHHVKDLIITVLFYPLIIPLFLFLHKATSLIFSNQNSWDYIGFIAGYDMIFVFLSSLLYEFIIEENA